MKLLLIVCVLGNSSQVSDGAGAVLLMKRRVALAKNLPILGVFRCVFVFFVLHYLS
jgi:acetyl-CoA acetyltransferase